MSMSNSLVKLNIFNKYNGCSNCPFVKENGEPCDHEKQEVEVRFGADSFQNGIGHRLWSKGNRVKASAVVIGGICFCAKSYAKVINNIYDFIWLEPGSMQIYLVVEDTSKKTRKPSRWERREAKRRAAMM